jgi:hypothetical protein
MTFQITALGVCIFWTILAGIINIVQVFTEESVGYRIAHLLTGVGLLVAGVLAL